MTDPVDGYVPFTDAVRRVVDLAFSEAAAAKIVLEAIETDCVRLRDSSGQEFRCTTTPERESLTAHARVRREEGRSLGRYDPYTRSRPGAERFPARPSAVNEIPFRHYRVNLSDLRQVLQRDRGLNLPAPTSLEGTAAKPPPGFLPFDHAVREFERRVVPSPFFPRSAVKTFIENGILDESIKMWCRGDPGPTTWRRCPTSSSGWSSQAQPRADEFDVFNAGRNFDLDERGPASAAATYSDASEFESPEYTYCRSDIEAHLENAAAGYGARIAPAADAPSFPDSSARRRGRPPKVDWEALKDDTFARLTSDGYPGTQADVIDLMRNLLEAQGLSEVDMPERTQLQEHARAVEKRLNGYLQREDMRSGRMAGK